jgi:hypothetical protein
VTPVSTDPQTRSGERIIHWRHRAASRLRSPSLANWFVALLPPRDVRERASDDEHCASGIGEILIADNTLHNINQPNSLDYLSAMVAIGSIC